MYTYTYAYISSAILAFAYDMFGICCKICRNQSMAPRCYYSDSCTCERPPFERQRQRQRQTETDRQTDNQRQIDRQTDRQTDRQRETERVRQEVSQTSRHNERQQERQTDKQKNCSMSLPFSLFLFHARPGLTRIGQGRRIYIFSCTLGD